MNRILKQIIIIIVLSIGLGLFRFILLQEDNFTLIKVEEPDIEYIIECNIDPSEDMKEAKNISVECVKEYFDNNLNLEKSESEKAIIIDSRTTGEYVESHIAGAINLYAEDFEQLIYKDDFSGEEKYYLDENDKELPFDQIYIIYCNGGICPDSKTLAGKMYEKKFKKVFIYKDGLPDWIEQGYPVEGIEKTTVSPNLFYFLFLLILTVLIIIVVSASTSNNTYAVVGFRLILGIIFIYASYSKIIDPGKFSSTVDLYKATPITINNLIALIVPWVELLIGFGLILNRSVKGSIIISIGLFITFIILLSQAYYRGFTLDCGCFGGSEKLSDAELRSKMLIRIAEDIIYLFMSIYLYFIYVFKKNNNAN